MYKAARTIAAEGTTITKGFHNLRRIPRRLVLHCGNLNPTYVSSGSFAPVSGWAARPSMSAAPPIATENSRRAFRRDVPRADIVRCSNYLVGEASIWA